MAFTYDSEFAAAVAQAGGPIELAQAAPGDWQTLRDQGDVGQRSRADRMRVLQSL